MAEVLGILRKDYHGKSFEGHQCSKLLDNCDALALLVPSECLPIIDCLKAFARVTEATFGDRLSSNCEEVSEQFGVTFSTVMSQFRLSMTPKIHSLLLHVPHFIRLTCMALGPFHNKLWRNSTDVITTFSINTELIVQNISTSQDELVSQC